jgi:hypothetical protein
MPGRPASLNTLARQKSQQANAKKPRRRNATAADRVALASQADEAAALDERVREQMARYDGGLGAATTWAEAKTREQTQTEIWRSEQARLAALAERGRLVDRSLLEQVEQEAHDEIGEALTKLPAIAVDLVQDLPPHLRQQVQAAIVEAINHALGGGDAP